MSLESNQSPTFTCPTCGALLGPDTGDHLFCEYCGSSLPGRQPAEELPSGGSTEPQDRLTPAASDEMPDWLAELSAAARQAEEEAELPEWLDEAEPPSPQEVEVPPAGPEQRAAEEPSPEGAAPGRRRRVTRAALLVGVLLLGLFCLLIGLLCSSLGTGLSGGTLLGGRTREVTVVANQPWQTTGIRVRRGQVVSITYLDGTWAVLGGARSAQMRADAAGFESEVRAAGLPLASAPVGALLGRIGDGMPFLVGREVRFQSREDGRLQLRINDQFLGDNVGAVQVRVQVTSDQ